MDVFMFYSNTIFKAAGLRATTITGLVGVVNFVTTLVGMAALGYFGRRTLMLWGNALMALIMILSGVAQLYNWNTLMVVLVLGFIGVFEITTGPVLFVYNA